MKPFILLALAIVVDRNIGTRATPQFPFDHVPPPSPDLGIREPMVIVSPFARAGYTDSTNANFMSMLAYTEHTFGLAPLSQNDAARPRPTRCAARGPKPRQSACRPPTRAISSLSTQPRSSPAISCWSRRAM